MFRNPLLFLDHGPAHERALSAAVGLAQDLHSRLTIVHPIDEAGAYVSTSGATGFNRLPELLTHGERLLATTRDSLPADLPCETRLLRAPKKAVRQILELIEQEDFDVLVIGCECHPAPGWHVFSCEAHRLVHESPIPVFVVTDSSRINGAGTPAVAAPDAVPN